MDAEPGVAARVAGGERLPSVAPQNGVAGLLPLDGRCSQAPRVVAITDLKVWHEHVWQLQSLVAPALRQRSERLRDARERERRLLAYALHRLLVAKVLGRETARIEIGRMSSGMPMVAGLPNIATSLSHAGDFVAFAISRDAGMIGVDVEASDHAFLLDGLADNMLHPRERSDASPPNVLLMDAWVRKEAVLKAVGSGLSIDMNTFASGQGCEVSGLATANGLRAWSVRACGGRVVLGVAAPEPDGLLVRFEPGSVDVVSLREHVMRM